MSPAPKGNQFWKLRSKHGRDKIIKSSEILWEAACEYFDKISNNPITVQDNKGTKHVNTVSLLRPFTLHGLCIFLDIDRVTYYSYRDNEDYSTVVHKIDDIIYNQKFEGATIGIFNHNIIARDLGLTDKQDIDHTSKGERIALITGVKIIKDGDREPPTTETD